MPLKKLNSQQADTMLKAGLNVVVADSEDSARRALSDDESTTHVLLPPEALEGYIFMPCDEKRNVKKTPKYSRKKITLDYACEEKQSSLLVSSLLLFQPLN